MNVLVVDVGGTSVKILATAQSVPRKFPSGPELTAQAMVAGVKATAQGWAYDAVAVGYPGAVLQNRPVAEPHNLAAGWVGFDYQDAFGCPVKIINDAAMQALGSYNGGTLLFLGLGTGLGTAMIVDGVVQPMELGHMPYRKATYEDYVGLRGLERLGKKKWQKRVADVVARMISALEPTDVVIGGGNVRKLDSLPPGCRLGDNANAFVGGFRMWAPVGHQDAPVHVAPSFPLPAKKAAAANGPAAPAKPAAVKKPAVAKKPAAAKKPAVAKKPAAVKKPAAAKKPAARKR
jgi:polyphosphate glucokinase